MKIVKKIAVLLLVIFIGAQFFRPDKNKGDSTAVIAFFDDTNPPKDVKLILENTCLDCHSDYTYYPWYSHITPVNYWMADHITHGKTHFNMSRWKSYSEAKKDEKLDELIKMVEAKKMPLTSYTWLHKDADLSQAQIDAVVSWANNVRLKYIFLEAPL
ncbi:heme-binding domain-containing protein [Winogradskyella vidalii]|uniref:heme-binding domain-containing protein n=1 Tax=Winogradskyella vidalii TaxID=2615024 RepID=UPI0015CB3A31|nr:heme-binding domain-containing protein [Winogradskyella vidalii]